MQVSAMTPVNDQGAGLRLRIRREVELIHPVDLKEAEARRATLEWVDSGVELCRVKKPATPPRHLVSYFAVVDHDHVLLVDHISAGLWLPSGGHVEPGEHPREAVEREAREELSIVAHFAHDGPVFLTMTETVGNSTIHTDVSLWYVLHGDRHAPLVFDRSECLGVRWFHFDEVPVDRSDPEMARFASKWRALIRCQRAGSGEGG
jgi:8-oxo-dGTP diphosphatase